MDLVAFRPEHLRDLDLQPAQAWLRPLVQTPEYLRAFMAADTCTAIHEGRVVAIGALTTVWPGRAHATALIAGSASRCFYALHCATAARLAASGHRRIEATVEAGFGAGHRWLRLLGFTCETPHGMAGYTPAGGKSYLYAKVYPHAR